MKYITERIRSILRLNDPPHRLASAVALGVFIAFSPTIGLHTITCILLAWALRLSKFAVITAAFVNNPWTIVPIYGFCLWLGIKVTGGAKIPHIAWDELTFSNAYHVLNPYLWPFVVGTLIAGIVAAGLSYGVVYWAVKRYRKTDVSTERTVGGAGR